MIPLILSTSKLLSPDSGGRATQNRFERELDPKSDGFGNFISFFQAECDNFQGDVVSNFIKDCLLKLQKALNQE